MLDLVLNEPLGSIWEYKDSCWNIAILNPKFDISLHFMHLKYTARFSYKQRFFSTQLQCYLTFFLN